MNRKEVYKKNFGYPLRERIKIVVNHERSLKVNYNVMQSKKAGMKNLITISVVVLLISISACSNSQNTELSVAADPQASANIDTVPSQPAIPELPRFSLQDVHGNILPLQSLKGKKVFVNLWASWCPPCKREMPSIAELFKGTDTGKVAFVMIALDDQFEKAKSFVHSAKLALPIYYPAENLPGLFNVEGIPSTFIFDENGLLIKRVEGGEDYTKNEYRALLK